MWDWRSAVAVRAGTSGSARSVPERGGAHITPHQGAVVRIGRLRWSNFLTQHLRLRRAARDRKSAPSTRPAVIWPAI